VTWGPQRAPHGRHAEDEAAGTLELMRILLADQRDFLDEIVDERRERNPEFPDLVRAALERRAAGPEHAVAAPEPAAEGADLGEIVD